MPGCAQPPFKSPSEYLTFQKILEGKVKVRRSQSSVARLRFWGGYFDRGRGIVSCAVVPNDFDLAALAGAGACAARGAGSDTAAAGWGASEADRWVGGQASLSLSGRPTNVAGDRPAKFPSHRFMPIPTSPGTTSPLGPPAQPDRPQRTYPGTSYSLQGRWTWGSSRRTPSLRGLTGPACASNPRRPSLPSWSRWTATAASTGSFRWAAGG